MQQNTADEQRVEQLQENHVPAANQNRQHCFIYENTGLRVLFVGNSITKHFYKPEIGWYRDNGMAASAPEKDYVHVLMQKIRDEIDPNAAYAIAQVAAYERGFFTMQPQELYQAAADFHADLIIMFFGANVDHAYDTMDNPPIRFGQAYENLRAFLNPDGRARVVHAQGFYIRPVLDEEKRQVARKYGDPFVELGDIRTRDETHGDFNHPSDQGMAEIAETLWQVIK